MIIKPQRAVAQIIYLIAGNKIDIFLLNHKRKKEQST